MKKWTHCKTGNPVIRVVDLPQSAVNITSSRVDREILGNLLSGIEERVDHEVIGRVDVPVSGRHSHDGLSDWFGL